MTKVLPRLLMLSLLLLQAHSTVHAKDPTVIALFGDSITVGFNSSFFSGSGLGRVNYGVPSIHLTELLNGSRRPSVVPNWGEGGSPSGPSLNPGLIAFTNGLERISNTLLTTKNDHDGRDYYVLIMYGTNDFNWSIPPSVTGQNTRLMIQRARSRGFVPVVATLTPRKDRSIASYNSQIAAAAAVEGAVMIDHFSAFNSAGGFSLLDDNVHPTNAGYEVIAETWFNQYLESAIEQDAAVVAPMINLLLDD